MKRFLQPLRAFLKKPVGATTRGFRCMAGNRQQQFLLLRVLGWTLVAVLSTLAFVLLAGEVVEGDTRAFDVLLLHEAQALQAAQVVAQTATVNVLHGDEQAQFRVAKVVNAND